MKAPLGIFGGTFAPVHNGHLRLAIEAREQLQLSGVRLIPAPHPPLRNEPHVPFARRLRWVKLAIGKEPGLVADPREQRGAGPSYTVDTLAGLRAEFPRAPLCLLLGEDQARQLPRWRRWEALIDYAHLVFFNRGGEPAKLAAPLARHLRGRQARSVRDLHRKTSGLWWRCEMPPLAISSSDLRARLRDGRSLRGLVPDPVLNDFNRSDLEMLRRS